MDCIVKASDKPVEINELIDNEVLKCISLRASIRKYTDANISDIQINTSIQILIYFPIL